MPYNINPIQNKHRKKSTHCSGVFIVILAFLAFIVIGLTISLSIRSCSQQKSNVQREKQYTEPTLETLERKRENSTEISIQYKMPDSVVKICMSKPIEGVSELIIHKMSYIVSYNQDTKIPNWVAWHLTADHTDGPYGRLSNFHEEEEVPTPRATLEDYRKSGWSRGHMCPAGDNKWDKRAMYESFSLVNVCPQNSSHNSGLWNGLEMDCRKWARQYGDIYIVCGPVFMNHRHEKIGKNEVFVPEAFFKVILCLKGKPKAFGIITRNTAGNNKRDLFYNSIDQVERVTGIDFFPALPDELEDRIESDVDMNMWN